MSKVYVVTTGSYSDYGVRAIFSTRKKAEEYMERCKAANNSDTENDGYCYVDTDFNSIEEWTLDEGLQERAYDRWHVGIMLDDGSLEYGKSPTHSKQWGVPQNEARVDEHIPIHKGRGAVRVYSCKSAEHALKLAAEKRQEWLRRTAQKRGEG